jgi:hypothetical protein
LPARGRLKKRPAAKKGRRWDADDPRRYHFKSDQIDLPWNNDEWGRNNLFAVRLAAVICNKDWRECREAAQRFLGPDGGWKPELTDMFDDLDRVRDHLRGLISIIDAAKMRTIISCAYFAPPPKELSKRIAK